MKILVTWSKWGIPLGESYVKAFRQLGHEAEIFYDNAPSKTMIFAKISRRLGLWNRYNKFLLEYQDKISGELIRKVREYNPDVVFVVRGIYFTPAAISMIREKYKVRVVNWVIDDPSFPNIYEPSLLYNLGPYDFFFLVDEEWKYPVSLVSRSKMYYLPHAADEQIFRPTGSKKDIEVFFVGSLSLKYPNTASAVVRSSLLSHLAERGVKITAVAPGIAQARKSFPSLRKIEAIESHLSPEKINEFYNRSKIVLNINAPQLKSDFSERLFSIALSKNFQLVDFRSKLGILFPNRVISFSSMEELENKTRFYLNHEKERNDVALLAYQHALDNHTYTKRAKYVLKKIHAYQ